MDIATQINTYFAAPADASLEGEFVPKTTGGNNVTPLIDGRNYFGEVRKLLDQLGKGSNISKQFFYIAGWWNHLSPGAGLTTTALLNMPSSRITRNPSTMPTFQLEDNTVGPYPAMAELLAEKAANGVDVRVLSWVNPYLLYKFVGERNLNWWDKVAQNIFSINYLRNLTYKGMKPLAKRVCALTVGNWFGAMHYKMIVAYDGQKPWAFTGGMDLVPNRVAKVGHPDTDKTTWRTTLWHDMSVAINGPAVQAFYDLFCDLWNEQLKRIQMNLTHGGVNLSGQIVRFVEPGTAPLDKERKLPSNLVGKHFVQVARTLPQFNFGNKNTPLNIQITGKGPTTPLSFATNGVFEIKVALKKAIGNATKLIYIEDPAYWSHEVMSWIRDSVKKNPQLRVVMLASWQGDPHDPELADERVEAVNNHLLDKLQPDEKSRIGFYLISKTKYYVHTKVTIIDDYWIFVGSANCARRSLYTDGELSVGILDENLGSPLAKNVRINLWAEHLCIPSAQKSSLASLDNAFTLWPSKASKNKGNVERASIPLPRPYVFRWYEIPGKDNDRLIKYLFKRYNMEKELEKNVKIEKIDNFMTIKILIDKNPNSYLIKLNNTKTEAILEVNGSEDKRFKAEVENGVLIIYNPFNKLMYDHFTDYDSRSKLW